MRTKTLHLLLATLFIAGTATIAWAATVQKTKFKGSQATASISASATVTCDNGVTDTAFVNGFISGSQSVLKMKGAMKSANNGVTVDVFSFFNPCTNTFIGFSEAGVAGDFSPPNKQLASATLEGQGLLQDFDSGMQVPIDVDVVITGTGPISASSASSKTKTFDGPGGPVTITIDRSANSNRVGLATGTITIQ